MMGRGASQKDDIESAATSLRSNEELSGPKAGTVRGITRTKLVDVSLEDVINGKHLPPLTLRDFEDFLAFKTKSAENLYFELFMRQYEKLYAVSPPHLRTVADSASLESEYQLCLSIFFDETSPLELNTSADLREDLDARISKTTEEPFLPPDAFAKVRADSNDSLAASFKAFISNQSRNADRNRAIFAQSVGIGTWIAGFVPTIVCSLLDKSRAYRALGLIFWWFGMVTYIGGFRRTCLIIFFFGDSRQLYPWELSAMNAMSAVSLGMSAYQPSPNPSLLLPSNTPERRRSSGYSNISYFPVFEPSEGPGSEVSSQKTASLTNRKLYFAPSHILPTIPGSSPTWAPVTRVLSPLVRREQRDNILSAAGLALAVTIVTAAICFSVPNRH